MTCWGLARDWQDAGAWDTLQRALLAKLRNADRIDFSRASVDSSSVRAMYWGKKGPNPTDQRKAGSKHHLLVDAAGRAVNWQS